MHNNYFNVILNTFEQKSNKLFFFSIELVLHAVTIKFAENNL